MQPNPAGEHAIRAAALQWLDLVTDGGVLPVSREELAGGFTVQGERFPLVDRGRGIRKPLGWSAALSITTAFPKSGRPRPYEDDEGVDGLRRYKFRRDTGGNAENSSLRSAMAQQLPLIWFYGVRPSLFQVISPIYVIAEEAAQDQFVLALTQAQRLVTPGSAVEESIRQYLVRQTKQRLHQPVFASQVMLAYHERCAVCALNHRELLDAAHIIPDSKPDGLPIVPNGLALCKIHHAAYDRNILGIRPDHVIEIRSSVLHEHDGPMLRHGLQALHGASLLSLPDQRRYLPDPQRLQERYAEFSAA